MRIKDSLRRWGLIIGLGIWGPALLGFATTCLIVGEIPGKKGVSVAKASDNPVLFYLLATVFIIAAIRLSCTTLGAAWRIYKISKPEKD